MALSNPDQSTGQGQLADHGRHLHPDAQKADKPEQSLESLKFFDWAYSQGDKLASDMDCADAGQRQEGDSRQLEANHRHQRQTGLA